MLIDWFTVGAQVFNFLILVWLLKRFLYKPILAAIAVREKRIADSLADAAAKNTAAGKERDDFAGRNKAFDAQRAALLAKATEEARLRQEQLLVEARKAGDALRAQQAAALQIERDNLGQELARQAGAEVFAIARKTLADLATASLEERISEVFTRRLRELDTPGKAALAAAIKTSNEPALLRSRFELPAGAQAAIRNALNETFSADVRLKFETAGNTLGGIELSVGGQKLAWSIDGYLGALEQKLRALLAAQEQPAVVPKVVPKAEPKAEPEAKAA